MISFIHARENIDDEAAALLAEHLRKKQGFEKIVLCNNKIGHLGAAALGSAFSFNFATLQLVNLCDNRIGDEGAVALVPVFAKCNALRILEMGSNAIGDVGTLAIAQHCAHVHELGLSGNNIGPIGAAALAMRPRVDLNCNKLGDAGAIAFANNMSESIEVVRMISNGIGDAGVVALAIAAAGKLKLKEMCIGFNCFGDAGADALARTTFTCPSLKLLYLCDAEFGDVGITAFARTYLNYTLYVSGNSSSKAGNELLYRSGKQAPDRRAFLAFFIGTEENHGPLGVKD